MSVRPRVGALEELPFRLLWAGRATSALGHALLAASGGAVVARRVRGVRTA